MVSLIMATCLSLPPSNVSCETILAIAEIESSYNKNAVGSANELGLFQLHPKYFDARKGDVRHNMLLARNYLEQILERHGDKCFVSYYNLGINYKLKDPCSWKYYKKWRKAYDKIRNKNLGRRAVRRSYFFRH